MYNSKKIIIPLFILLFNFYNFSQSEPNDLQSSIDELITDPFFESSSIAIDIFNLTECTSLYRHNEKLLLNPASNMKILTSAAALYYLDSDFKFKTELYHTGIITEKILYGNLYVVGGFDPLFKTEELDSLIKSIQLLQVKTITGNIYADLSIKDSLYWGNGWAWDDEPDSDAPHLSALNINGNCVEVFVKAGEIDSPAVITLIPETDYVQVSSNAVTVNPYTQSDFDVTRDWVNQTNKILIDGVVNTDKIIDSLDHLEKISVIYPEKYFLFLFKEHLKKNGISVSGEIEIKKIPENKVLLGSVNRPIDSVFVYMNKESDNLCAEMLLYAMAFDDSGAPASAENGIAVIEKLIDEVGFDAKDYSLADGSGVSRYNLLSAELILEVLKDIYYNQPELYPDFYSSLPIGGIDGTLKKRMQQKPLLGNVHAKTGTLQGVSGLSGYLTSNNKQLIAFSILIQNYTGKSSAAHYFLDTICEYIANSN